MSFNQIIISIFCGICLFNCILIVTVLLFQNGFKQKPQLFLALMLMGLGFRLAKSFFVFVPISYPGIGIMLGATGLLSVGPAHYLYSLSSIGRKINPIHYLTFLPSIALIITYIVGDASKPISWAYVWGIACLGVFQAASVVAVKGKGLPRSYTLFSGGVALFWIIFVLQYMINSINFYAAGTFAGALILYAINFRILTETSFFSLVKTPKQMDEKQASEVLGQVEELMKYQELFKQKGLSINEVAKYTGQPAYLISQSINSGYGINFNEYVNRFRIEATKKMLADAVSNDKVESIASQVGFKSNTSLYQAFKKETGMTPHQYRKQLIGQI
ncbi:AraC family transcriptional regulator [Emticicia sp. C21]|uniref:helix-turn-helix domain-containing protein n=1 Tax=Emticicia sp. C21 TaxID=2302915 RepID=UPI000E342D30|nr:AraC family transcriptional regulator [Emticicia sp. C21]RFS14859.1 AraC family transcriptional regulator [Emticicia sp. C21]